MAPMTPLRLRLRELREAKGWSQARLANELGTRQARISDLETGRVQRIDLPLLDRLARVLGVDVAELLQQSPSRKEGRRA